MGMPLAPIIFDMTRLVTRLGRLTPNGIDRVDLAYARYLSSCPLDVLVAVMGPDGKARLASRHALVAVVDAISHAWDEVGDAPSSSPLGGVPRAQGTHSKPGRERTPRRTTGSAEFTRLAAGWFRLQRTGALVGQNGLWPGKSLATGAPQGAVYLNVSQFPIWRPGYLAALDRRPDVRCYFLLHDLLPIRYPEFFRPFEVQRHVGRLQTIAKHASGIIVSSELNRRDLMVYFRERQVRPREVIVAPLSIEAAFRIDRRVAAGVVEGTPIVPYFVCVGTIEPRKNHLLLLHVWRELVARLGAQAPDLVLVGGKGWLYENVFDMLERCPSIMGRVRLVSDLSTPSLVTLLHGAEALLMPTFAEGYGLPVAEAVQSGVPVIASDIEAFREADAPGLRRIDPTDGLGWVRAIIEHMHGEQAACLDVEQTQPPKLCGLGHVEGVIRQISTHGLDSHPGNLLTDD
ncbi:MAG: glycosyltransferase family 1 protein [Hyphomicrobium sp.]